MANNSITASTSTPFNSLLLTDSNYIVSTSSFAATAMIVSTPSVNFQTATPYPTIANTLFYVSVVNTTTSTGSVTVVLQESSDNSTWAPMANIANPILTSSGSVAAQSVTVSPQSVCKQYVRLAAISGVGAVPTGSATLTVLM